MYHYLILFIALSLSLLGRAQTTSPAPAAKPQEILREEWLEAGHIPSSDEAFYRDLLHELEQNACTDPELQELETDLVLNLFQGRKDFARQQNLLDKGLSPLVEKYDSDDYDSDDYTIDYRQKIERERIIGMTCDRDEADCGKLDTYFAKKYEIPDNTDIERFRKKFRETFATLYLKLFLTMVNQRLTEIQNQIYQRFIFAQKQNRVYNSSPLNSASLLNRGEAEEVTLYQQEALDRMLLARYRQQVMERALKALRDHCKRIAGHIDTSSLDSSLEGFYTPSNLGRRNGQSSI